MDLKVTVGYLCTCMMTNVISVRDLKTADDGWLNTFLCFLKRTDDNGRAIKNSHLLELDAINDEKQSYDHENEQVFRKDATIWAAADETLYLYSPIPCKCIYSISY